MSGKQCACGMYLRADNVTGKCRTCIRSAPPAAPRGTAYAAPTADEHPCIGDRYVHKHDSDVWVVAKVTALFISLTRAPEVSRVLTISRDELERYWELQLERITQPSLPAGSPANYLPPCVHYSTYEAAGRTWCFACGRCLGGPP
jgi:hypothetical protein